ncbi:MAG: hypothetical protein R2854_23735 [Caldilineaceae bacterium]
MHALPVSRSSSVTTRTPPACRPVSEHVRFQVPDPAELLIVSCVDLHHVPKMFRAGREQSHGQGLRHHRRSTAGRAGPARPRGSSCLDRNGSGAGVGFDDVGEERAFWLGHGVTHDHGQLPRHRRGWMRRWPRSENVGRYVTRAATPSRQRRRSRQRGRAGPPRRRSRPADAAIGAVQRLLSASGVTTTMGPTTGVGVRLGVGVGLAVDWTAWR